MRIDATDPWQFKNFLVSGPRLMIESDQLEALASEHGTPLFVVDHDELRTQLCDV